MNDAAARYDGAVTALFYPFHVADFAADTPPQTTDIHGTIRQWFRALTQNRQRKVCVAATRGIALGDVGSPFTRTIEYWQFAVVDGAAVAGQCDGICGQRRSRGKFRIFRSAQHDYTCAY